jgi:signal transduction histidine kinase
MSASWPLEAIDEPALPPPWDGDIDVSDPQTESALLALQHGQPALALAVCHSVFCRAEARGDRRAAIHALYLAYVSLYNSSQRALADRVFAVLRERAPGMAASQLSARIELARANQLSEQGEHAQAMVIRQRALDLAMALGDNRLIFLALGNLAASACEAGESSLMLSLCEQQEPLLAHEDSVIAGLRCHRADLMALAWKQIAHAREAAEDRAAARVALQQAREFALSACAKANNDREALHCLETLVQILLGLDEAVEARVQVERCMGRLSTVPVAGSELWCVLELAQARIAVHARHVGIQTLETLQAIEASAERDASDVRLVAAEVQALLLQAHEQLGHYEQAVASHKRATEWHAKRHSAQSRQRMKMLRHTVLAMRAEAVEFITHDLLTPLAAAQMWLQALLGEPLPAVVATPLRDVHWQLGHGTKLSDRYLGLWCAELTPGDHLQVLDLGALADDVCENFMPPWLAGPVRLERDLEIGTCIRGNRSLLTRALAVLLQHAFERAEKGTPVRLHLSATAGGTAGRAVLAVHYRGDNLSASLRTRVYQQFADGAPVDATALGWLLVTRVAQLHHANLRFDATQSEGSDVQLSFALSGLLQDDANL